MTLHHDDFESAIQALGLQDKCVEIHSSFKSFGCQVDGGAQTVIDSFLDENCTVLVFAGSYMYEVYPPPDLRPLRNGAGDYSYFTDRAYDAPKTFTTTGNDISRDDMGLIPYTLVNMPSRKRGYNPLNSFAAVGTLADQLVREQSATDVFAPLRKLYELDGAVVLMGVGLNNATIIHYAEQLAGRAPFVRWANNPQGKPAICNTGSCSNGFNRLADSLKETEKNITVGNSLWRCFPARAMVDACVDAIKSNPEVTHCANPHCDRCHDAVLGGPIWA